MTDNNSLVLDLCSGLGGASQAFDQEQVVKIDIDLGFNPTIQADVKNLPLRSDLKPDVVLFCPPCEKFSVMSIPRYWKQGRPEDAIRLVEQGLEEIHRLNPRHWIMENPRAMLRTVIGKPRTTINQSDYGSQWKKPTDLWGNVNLPMVKAVRFWIKAPRGSHRGVSDNHSAAERAKWPYGLSEAVRDACNHTNTSKEKE